MQRLFIAFPITGDAAREVERVQRKLEEQNSRVPITWTRTKPHCTVAFFGDCDEATTTLLKERLLALAGSGVIPAQLGFIDAFPNQHRPRVLIVHIDDPSRGITGLYERVIQITRRHSEAEQSEAEESHTIGIRSFRSWACACSAREAPLRMTDRKPFIPHVTLGRVKQENARVRGFDMPVHPVAFEVSEVVLFASELLPNGPRHTALLSVSFRPSPDLSGRVEKSN